MGASAAARLERALAQTRMEEAGISDLRSERMGREVPGMRERLRECHPALRDALTAMLQERWERDSVSGRSYPCPRSCR